MEKLGLSSGEFLLSPGKVGYLWFASCGSPRVLAPWAGLESEVKGNESGSCSVCIRNLITKKYVKGDGYWKQELVLGIQLFIKTCATLKSSD